MVTWSEILAANKAQQTGVNHKDPEHQLQVQCVTWFRRQYSGYAKLLFAVPNGGQRNAIVARKLKLEGVVAGVADLMLAIPNTTFHGFVIEMKNGKKGTQSKLQKEWQRLVEKQGYKYSLCRSFEEFEELIKDYLSDK
jgi:hypothetical protein